MKARITALIFAVSMLLSGCESYTVPGNAYTGLDPLQVAKWSLGNGNSQAERAMARFAASFIDLMQYVGFGGFMITFAILMTQVIRGKIRSKEELFESFVWKLFLLLLLMNVIKVGSLIMNLADKMR